MGNSAILVQAGREISDVREDHQQRSFGIVLRNLVLAEGITTGVHSPNWVEVADRLPGVHYETLRKAVAGDRPPAPKLMEIVAEGFGVEPDIFYEYRLYRAQRDFDPREVGVEQALENLSAWADTRGVSPARRRKRR